MPTTYSVDLRQKVMEFTDRGGSVLDAAAVFGVGKSTVYRWRVLRKAGDISPKKREFLPMVMDPEKLTEYVRANPDHTLKQIAAALQVGAATVFKWLRRLKITLKKSPHYTERGMRKRERRIPLRSVKSRPQQ